MADEKIGNLCYKKNGVNLLAFCKREGDEAGRLIFYTGKFGWLMTWWDFDERHTTGMVRAFINGKCVCEGHSTGHIIDYDVISDAEEIVKHDDGSVGYVFSMSITGVGGYCNFRCWRAGTEWDEAEENKKAEVSGTGTTIARFELLRNTDYTWTLRAI